MREQDVKIGMKVVPHRKTGGFCSELNKCYTWNKAKNKNQNFLFVVKKSDDVFVLSDKKINYKENGLFDASDFEPYIEKQFIKYLTHDEIRNLPHGTKIKFTDNYHEKDRIVDGVINQKHKMIGCEENINWNHWFFTSLEKREVKAWIEEINTPKNEVHNIKLIFNNTTTIAILQDKNGKTIKKSLAKLDPNDVYNKGEGVKIAVLRVLGEEVKFKEDVHECKCNKKELKDYTNDELLEEVKRRFDK